MYITIIDIIGISMVNLSYPIKDKEVAVVTVFSDNIKYEFTEPRTMDDRFGVEDKPMIAGTYMR